MTSLSTARNVVSLLNRVVIGLYTSLRMDGDFARIKFCKNLMKSTNECGGINQELFDIFNVEGNITVLILTVCMNNFLINSECQIIKLFYFAQKDVCHVNLPAPPFFPTQHFRIYEYYSFGIWLKIHVI
jgi:hypothetical protein